MAELVLVYVLVGYLFSLVWSLVMSAIKTRTVYRIYRNENNGMGTRLYLTHWDTETGIAFLQCRKIDAKRILTAASALQQLTLCMERHPGYAWTVDTATEEK